eukprot:296949_1
MVYMFSSSGLFLHCGRVFCLDIVNGNGETRFGFSLHAPRTQQQKYLWFLGNILKTGCEAKPFGGQQCFCFTSVRIGFGVSLSLPQHLGGSWGVGLVAGGGRATAVHVIHEPVSGQLLGLVLGDIIPQGQGGVEAEVVDDHGVLHEGDVAEVDLTEGETPVLLGGDGGGLLLLSGDRGGGLTDAGSEDILLLLGGRGKAAATAQRAHRHGRRGRLEPSLVEIVLGGIAAHDGGSR